VCSCKLSRPIITPFGGHRPRLRPFAAAELPSRQEHLYPPFASLIRLIIRGESEPASEQIADAAGEKLRAAIEVHRSSTASWAPPPAPSPNSAPLSLYVLVSSPAADQLRTAVRSVVENLEPVEGVQWVVDVDPLDLL
jgi:primosomal protein N'